MVSSRLAMRLFPRLTLVLSLVTLGAHAGAQEVIPLSEVRAGMRGHGLTVFQGTTPERFDVEVVGVLHQFLPRQDLIVIRMDHPTLNHSGTVGGMSGSPIYLGGRLAGALAYGWMFALDPIAGVTPIEAMLEELDRPLRPEGLPPALGAWPGRNGAHGVDGVVGSLGGRSAGEVVRAVLGPRPSYWSRFDEGDGPAPVATPLLLGGFSARVRRMMAGLFEELGLVPLESGGGGGGGARGASGEAAFVPGGAIGVQLVRGDLSATGIGTATVVRGPQVLAFGHPMFGFGQQHYPVTTARIVTILANRRRSFKLGEPLEEAGALVQDRQACIIADTRRRAPMARVVVTARDRTSGRRDRFELEVVPQRYLLPALAVSSVASALERFASDRSDLLIAVRGEIRIAGREPVVLEDRAFTSSGAADAGMLLGLRPLSSLATILANPFEPASIEAVTLDVELDYRRAEAEIIGAYVAAERLRAGERVAVNVVLRPYDGPEEVRRLMVDLPATAAGEEVTVHVTGGAAARRPLAAPRSLDDVIGNLGRDFAATSVVVTLQRRTPGVSLRGHVALDLPPSALDALRPLAADVHEQPLSTVSQVELPAGRIVSGSARLELEVEGTR
jgi:hypothetical protein